MQLLFIDTDLLRACWIEWKVEGTPQQKFDFQTLSNGRVNTQKRLMYATTKHRTWAYTLYIRVELDFYTPADGRFE